MYKTTRGLVLREVNYKDSSKILTVLTESDGRITVSAKGARRKGSRIAASSRLFAFSEMTLSSVKGRWYLSEGSTIELFSSIAEQLSRYALACYVCELLETVSDEDNPNLGLLRLGLNTLYVLSENVRDERLIKAVFELKLMCLCGYEPISDSCGACGKEDGEFRFDCDGGMLLCSDCAKAGTMPLLGAALAAIRYICGSDLRKVFSFDLQGDGLSCLSAICERYIETQLEHRSKTLIYYKKLESGNDTI